MSAFYPATALTGGGVGALDNIDGNDLADGDRAVVVTDDGIYYYRLYATSGAAESAPEVIAPDVNAGDKRWVRVDPLLTQSEMMQVLQGGQIVPEVDTDADHDINLKPGVAVLTDGAGNYKAFHLTANLCKQLDAAWAAGDDAGGFPSGLSLSADTMYYMVLIGKDDGTLDAGFDTDSAASQLLSDAADYSWYAVLRGNFAVFTDGSSNIRDFEIVNSFLSFASMIIDVDDSSLSDEVAETGTLTAPPDTRVRCFVRILSTFSAGGAASFYLRRPTFGATLGYIYHSADDTDGFGGTLEYDVDENSQVDYVLNVNAEATTDEIKIQMMGFYLTL